MSDIPKAVVLREVGPREGFQGESVEIKTEDKVRLIDALSETGLKYIEVTSFVSPKWIPQMKDAEEVAARFTRRPGVWYFCLTLNAEGVKRAYRTGKFDDVGHLFLMASETVNKLNLNKTVAEAIAECRPWAKAIKQYGYPLTGIGVGNAFGCNIEGDIPPKKVVHIIRDIMDLSQELDISISQVGLGDTVGAANPVQVMKLVSLLRQEFPHIEIFLHLHDTRGTGLANVLAGLQVGVTTFDCSIGGLGGCPYAKGAAGNVPTEDVALMCEEMGIETGLNLDKLIACAKLAEQIVGHPLPGKAKVGGRIKH